MDTVAVSSLQERSAVQRYGFALLATAAALGLRFFLAPIFGSNYPFLTVLAAVIFSVWYCGSGPAIASSLASFFGVWYWILAPAGSFSFQNLKLQAGGLIAFLLVCALIISLGEAHRRSEARLRTEVQERRRADESLRVNEERLRIAQRASRAGTYERDFLSGQIFSSAELREIYGLGAEVDVSDRAVWRRAVHPEDLPETDRVLQEAMRSRKTDTRAEFRIVRGDGALRWIETTARIFYDEGGQATRLVSVCRDVTERRQAADALRDSEANARLLASRMQLAADAAGIGFWSWDALADAIHPDENTRRILGLPASGPLFFKDFAEILHPEDRQPVEAAIDRSFRSGSNYDEEFRVIHGDGSVHWIVSRGSVTRDAGGQALGMTGVAIETTERKQVAEALRKNEDRLRLAHKAAASGAWEWNYETGEVFWSPEVEALYGLKPGEFGGTIQDWRARIHPEDLARMSREIPEVIAKRGEFRFEFRIIRADGQTRWIEGVGQVHGGEGPARLIGINSDITERKQAEETLRANEERLRMAYQAAHSGAWEVNLKTHEILWSAEMQGLWGLPPGTIPDVRATIQSMILAEDQVIVDRALADALAGAGYHLQFRIRRADGQLRWMESFGEVVYDEEKTPSRIVGVAIDITERRLAEQSLRTSEEQLRFIADRAQAGLWDWNLISGALEWSPLCKELFGIPQETVMSYERFLEAVHPDDREAADRANRSYLASGSGEYNQEYRVVWPDGSVRWIQAKGSAEFSAGRALRMAGIVLDITERKRNEETMRKNEERLRLAHKAAHSGAWEVDLASREIIWSPELQLLWGLTPGQAENIRRDIRRIILPEDHAKVDQALADVFESSTREYHTEYRMIRADGELRWNEAFGEVIRDSDGKPLRIVSVTVDTTERKQAEEALRRSHEELERKVEERTGELAASLASLEVEIEIRKQAEEALQALSARLLRLQDEERRRIARDLHDSTGQTLAALKMTLATLEPLVRDIPHAPAMVAELTSFTNDALKDIRTTSHLLHPPLLDEVGFRSAAQWYVEELAKRSGVKANLELAVPSGRLNKTTELAFFRVMQESLTNVIRHSGSASVDISLQADRENVLLTVRDYGKGIPAHILSHFHETGAGVGVGLGGMKQRIRELGGNLRIISNGEGTCISATLPMEARVSEEMASD
jgi:PAS domain S-box-containing protein